jgi:hypothetical protein
LASKRAKFFDDAVGSVARWLIFRSTRFSDFALARDVFYGRRGHSLKRKIDEPFERGPLLCPVKSPTALIDEISVLVSCHHTEEIFKSTLSDERIAFEIEKDVADRG